METLKINVNSEKVIELHFGSWVMGQLAKRGWGYTVKSVLDEIGKNPYESNALLVYLGQCSAQNKTRSLDELSLDDAYDLIDEINDNCPDEGAKIYDSFMLAMFGEDVYNQLKNISIESIEASEESGKKKATRKTSK